MHPGGERRATGSPHRRHTETPLDSITMEDEGKGSIGAVAERTGAAVVPSDRPKPGAKRSLVGEKPTRMVEETVTRHPGVTRGL